MMTIRRHDAFQRLPSAILFDLDNTLYSYNPAHTAAMDAVRSKVVRTLTIEASAFDKAFAEARAQIKARLVNTAASHHRLLYFQRMLEIIGLGSQFMLALDFEQTYWRTFLRGAMLFDDVKEFLDDLRLLGIPSVIVTDLTAQIQFRKVVYFGLERHFDYIVTSEEAGIDKPSEVPFKLAIEKIQLQAGQVWMIGDSMHNDLIGARTSLSATCIQKLHDGVVEGKGDEAPDATFQHFSELRALLVKLLSTREL